MKSAMRNWRVFFVLVLGVLPVHAQPPQQSEFDRAVGIVEKVRAGQTTLEKAFDEGLLTRPVLLAIIGEEHALDHGRGFWNPAEETYKWTGFLVEKYPEIVEEQPFLSYGARLRIALYLFSKRDARGAQIMEKILQELPRQNPDKAVLIAVLYRLSNYYGGIGENEKAIATSLKIREFDVEPADQANILLGAARGAWAAGDKENANKIYREVIGLGYGWATGHAHSDMAGHLMREGKLEEARALMKQKLEGWNGDQFQVILSSRLAQSYLDTGEWEQAREWAQTAVRQFEALEEPIKNHGLESYYESAKRLPEQIERAQANPIELHTRQIKVQMLKDAKEPVRTYFNFHSHRIVTPKITANDPAIKTWIFRDAHGYESGKYKMVGLEIGPEIWKREGLAEITISFAEFPDLVFHIPVIVTATDKETP